MIPGAGLVTDALQQRAVLSEMDHRPRPLHEAWAQIETNTMAIPLGIDLAAEPLLQPRQDVVIWPLRRTNSAPADF